VSDSPSHSETRVFGLKSLVSPPPKEAVTPFQT
jgi:hypothetical protein